MKRCTQTGSRRNPTMESHPPTRHSKKKVCDTRLTKCIFVPKMHFASIYKLHKAPGKALFGTNSAHFGLFWPFYGSEKAQKLRGAPTKYRQRCVKIPPKMGFGGIFDHLEAISIPSIPISKGIKNKNFNRFWVPRCPLALIGWQRGP